MDQIWGGSRSIFCMMDLDLTQILCVGSNISKKTGESRSRSETRKKARMTVLGSTASKVAIFSIGITMGPRIPKGPELKENGTGPMFQMNVLLICVGLHCVVHRLE